MSYKEIKITEGEAPTSIIDVEDVALDDAVPAVEEEGSVEINLTTGKEEAKEEVIEEVKEEAPKQAPVVTKEDKKPSRAQKRIKQLHTEKTDLQLKLEQAEQEKVDLQRKLLAGTKESKETVKSTLESSLTNLTGSLKDAIESGDSSEVVRLQDEMMTAKMQLAGVTSELTDFKDIPDTPAPKQNAQQGPSEKALDWIAEHPTFKTDELFYVSAMTVNNSLVKEGYDPESEDFYTELNSRLSTRFPEAFGIDEENSVEYSKDENSSKEPDVKQSKASSKQTQEQTMSGASRSPAGKANKPRGNDSVVLSPQMVKQADRWGITLEQMARRVAHSQKNSIGDGYVPILIDKK